MHFTEVLKKEQVLYFTEKLTYKELLQKSIAYIKSLYDISYSVEECVKEIINRDKLGNTAFNEGFAIPHVRFENLSGVHFIIVSTKHLTTVPQPTGDKQINVFAIYLTSKAAPNEYLSILSSTIKIFSKDKGKYLSLIKSAESIDSIYEVFKESDIEIKYKIKVRDIMNYYTVVVFPDDSVKDVMNRLYKHQTNTAYVIDKEEHLVGYISIAYLLKMVIPDYIDSLGDISFVREFDPFIKLLREEGNLSVKDVMGKIEQTLDPESSILEAAYYLSRYPKTNIPVIENGKLKGTVSPKNFLNKILRS